MDTASFPYYLVPGTDRGLPKSIMSCDVPVRARAPYEHFGAVRLSYGQQENGMPAKGQYDPTRKIEDAIIAALGSQTLHLGHIVHMGTWTVVVASTRPLPPVVSVKTGLFAKTLTFAIEPISGWEWFDHEMAPSPLDIERNRNEELISTLQKEGDQAHIVRPVDFGALFSSDQAREAFLGEVFGMGYRMGDASMWESDGKPTQYWCEITLNTSIEPDTIATHCLNLRAIAERLDGEFDGWATPLMRG